MIETGGDEPDSFGLTVTGFDRFYVRLKSWTATVFDPFAADFDNDKVSNGSELAIGTDPLHSADSDGDGMSDDWETRWGLDPQNPADATGPGNDPDGDGYSNLDEYRAAGTEGTDPFSFYNYGLPDILKTGGSQTAEPGTFSPQPLVIELKYGATPFSNGPVDIQIASGSSGQISLTNDGAGLTTQLHLHTGADGRVTVYFKNPSSPPGGDMFSTVVARLGSASTRGDSTTLYFGETTQVNYTYPAGTVGRHASDAIDTRLAGKDAAALPVFSTQNHTTATYVRKTDSWCYDLRQPMTCISPWNSLRSTGGAGTAITAQHVVCAWHFPLDRDVQIRFITANNVVVTRTIRGKADNQAADISVYTLETPLPATITPCKLLPANHADYLSYLGGGRPPVMVLDKQEKALVKDLRSLDIGAVYLKPVFHTERLPFYEDAEDGDSGNPAFLIINNALALLCTEHGGFGGTFLTDFLPTLNAMIAAADADATAQGYPTNTGFQVQTIDLSGFSTFTPP